MGSLAQLAKAAGWRVTGCDKAVYPPMSTQLEAAGITFIEGYSRDQLALKPDIFVIGNVVSRGNPLVEAILNRGCVYTSGPAWLFEHILRDRWVLGVSGTHGKTTTSSMLTWILAYAGFAPGYLIGGVPNNFSSSAHLGNSDFFVIEADEYDTAFFDKRSKFLHYHPRTLVINNLEYDHADIFPDLAAIQTQFHHLLRTVPEIGAVIRPETCDAIEKVIRQGCWSECQTSSSTSGAQSAQWQWENGDHEGQFSLFFNGQRVGGVSWDLSGEHNIQNATHAIAAAHHVGIAPELACEALNQFQGVRRRMELVGQVADICVYDDFAHHPTAIETTLQGLKNKVGQAPIWAIIEPCSNTMKLGVHAKTLLASSALADKVYWFEGGDVGWDMSSHLTDGQRSQVFQCHEALIMDVVTSIPSGVHVVIMSNGGFASMPRRLYTALGVQGGHHHA